MSDRIFVFGSNLAGRHGKGSALEARLKHGAVYGVGQGRTGNAYAIPTKDEILKILPLSVIGYHVKKFKLYAEQHPELQFDVVAIGCGLAGYESKQIAPFFVGCTSNVNLPYEFKDVIGEQA